MSFLNSSIIKFSDSSVCMTQLLRFRFQRCYSVTCRRLAPEDGNEEGSKMGLGEKKFKIDWTDKEYR